MGVYCRACGTEVADGVRYCTACGTEVARGDGGTEAQARLRRPLPARKKAAIAGVCVVVLAIVGSGGFFLAKAFLPSLFGLTFVNEAAFPDESLRQVVAQRADANGDGILTSEERDAVTAFDVSDLSALSGAGSLLNAVSYEDRPLLDDTTGSDPGAQGIKSLQGIEYFSHLAVLDCRGLGLTELDLSRNPDLAYVDCRNNDFRALDLSNSALLKALYCDDDVEVTGLPEAGLYYTDLVVGASKASEGSTVGPTRISVSYDIDGRIRSIVSGTDDGYAFEDTYSYDERGRLTSSSATFQSSYYSYEYNAAGMLQKESFEYADHGGATSATEYSYDDQGRLLAEETSSAVGSSGKITDTVRRYSYDDGGVVCTQSVEGNPPVVETLSYDEGGRLRSVETKTGDQDASASTCSYDERGICSSVTYSAQTDETTEYDENGFPLRTEIDRVSVDYTCNRDGYVTRAEWSADPSTYYEDGCVIEVSYIKRVAPLADRSALRYTPSLRFGSEFYRAQYLSAEWFQGNGGSLFVTVVESSPHKEPLRQLGAANLGTVWTPNEVALAAYDDQLFELADADNAHTIENPLESGGDALHGEADGVSPEQDDASATDVSLTSYSNGRYGFSISIPDTFELYNSSDNGAGDQFYHSDLDMTIGTWGENNIMSETVEQVFGKACEGKDVAYSHSEDDWFVVSYVEGDMVFYRKEYVGGGSVCGLELKYPTTSGVACGALVDIIVPTFKPGDLTEPH